jgi:transposase
VPEQTTPKRAKPRSKPRTPRKRRGPAPGITDELTARICSAIVVGATLDAAAAANGVPHRTFFDWLARGRAEGAIPVYRDFADQIEQALGRMQLQKLGLIDKATTKEWTAAAWILERRFPDQFGRRTRIDGQVQVQAIVASPEWIGLRDRVLAALQPYPDALEAVLKAVGAADQEAEVEGGLLELTA